MDGKVSSSSGKQLDVKFSIHHLTPQEKKKNALKALGMFWGISLATIPLPPIHWVTVPGFFLFGIYKFFSKMRESDYFEKLDFPCPECGKEVKLPAQVVQNPLSFVCPECRYGLKLSFGA